MSARPSTKLLVAAAVILAVASLSGSRSAFTTATTASTSPYRGSTHLTAYADNDGPTETIILTGTIGDYGKAVSIYPDGTIDPDHDSELSLQLSHGTFRLDIAALDKAFVQAISSRFPTDPATCSGSVTVTRQVPVIAGSGTGAYERVGGSFMLTATLDEVDEVSAAQPCDGTGAFLSQAIIMSGPGFVTF